LVSDFANAKVDSHYVTKEEQESKDFKEKNTLNCFPFLEVNDGKERIFTTNAINSFLASQSGNKDFAGASPMQEAQIDQWISLSSQVNNFSETIGNQLFGKKPYNAHQFNFAIKMQQDAARAINTGLQGKDFLLGKNLSLADVIIFVSMIEPF